MFEYNSGAMEKEESHTRLGALEQGGYPDWAFLKADRKPKQYSSSYRVERRSPVIHVARVSDNLRCFFFLLA